MSVENTIEQGLERIALALEEILAKQDAILSAPAAAPAAAPVAAPVKRTRKKKVEPETITPPVPAPVTEALPEITDLDPAPVEKTEEEVRAAAAPLVKVSGQGNRAGYEAAQAIIVKYGASIADIPPTHRGTVITELNSAFENWGL